MGNIWVLWIGATYIRAFTVPQFVVSIRLAEGLEPLGPRISVGTVMTKHAISVCAQRKNYMTNTSRQRKIWPLLNDGMFQCILLKKALVFSFAFHWLSVRQTPLSTNRRTPNKKPLSQSQCLGYSNIGAFLRDSVLVQPGSSKQCKTVNTEWASNNQTMFYTHTHSTKCYMMQQYACVYVNYHYAFLGN